MNHPADREMGWAVTRHHVLATGGVCSFVEDEIEPPGGGERFTRQYISHPGAVGIIATDEQDRVALIHQYRHPVGLELIEPPAGLLDVQGEEWLAAAQRELAEEMGLRATTWRVLVDICTSPGGSEESARPDRWPNKLSPTCLLYTSPSPRDRG